MESQSVGNLRLLWVKCSELEKENMDVTNMSTENELHLSESQNAKCPKCFSHQLSFNWIQDQNVLHIICIRCTYEWIE